MTVSTTLKYFFLPCLLAAAVPLRAAPAPMQATSTEPARIWTDGYGTGNGRLGILSFGVFPKEIVVFNEGSIFAKKNFQMKEGAAEALDKARELCKEGKYRSADQVFRKDILPPAASRGITSREVSSRWNSRGFPPLPPTGARWTCSGARLPPAFNSARENCPRKSWRLRPAIAPLTASPAPFRPVPRCAGLAASGPVRPD